MPTAYTSNRKIGALDLATTPLAATNELVINQNGDILKTPLSAVENKIFDAKTAVTAPTGTEVVVVRQTDNSLRQVALTDIVPALNITNAKISASAAIADTKLATINTAGKVTNNAVQAVSTNTANRIVTRDGSGNFSAGTITATLAGSITGNAPTATILATGRTIALTGDVTGTTGSFNGSANVSAATTIANNAVTTAKIADANVTTAKIADANVTTAKIADSGVTTAKIADAGVTTAKIADSGVTTAKIADSNVTTAKIADSGVTTAKIADANITLAKLVAAVQESLVPAGAVQAFARSTAPAGWLAANGNTIGNASSNATHAAATYEALFTVLWDNWSNTALPIITSGGAASTRGADAATDFAANKRLPLPNLNGIFIRGAGPAQTIGGNSYEGTFAAKQADAFKSHSHTYTRYFALRGGFAAEAGDKWASTATDSTSSTGGTETRPANIALLYCIKF